MLLSKVGGLHPLYKEAMHLFQNQARNILSFDRYSQNLISICPPLVLYLIVIASNYPCVCLKGPCKLGWVRPIFRSVWFEVPVGWVHPKREHSPEMWVGSIPPKQRNRHNPLRLTHCLRTHALHRTPAASIGAAHLTRRRWQGAWRAMTTSGGTLRNGSLGGGIASWDNS